MKIDLSKKPKQEEVKPEQEQKPKKESNDWLNNILLTTALVAVTVGMTYGLVTFTNANAMERVEVDSYDAIKEEHIALLEMDADEFFATVKNGDAGIAINLPKEKKEKSKKDLQKEVDELKKELEDVIRDATETEKELKEQLKESTSDVSENRKELKEQLEDSIRTAEENEQKLRDEITRITNHMNAQEETMQNNKQTIFNQKQTIEKLEAELRESEAREQELQEKLSETRGVEEDEEANQ